MGMERTFLTTHPESSRGPACGERCPELTAALGPTLACACLSPREHEHRFFCPQRAEAGSLLPSVGPPCLRAGGDLFLEEAEDVHQDASPLECCSHIGSRSWSPPTSPLPCRLTGCSAAKFPIIAEQGAWHSPRPHRQRGGSPFTFHSWLASDPGQFLEEALKDKAQFHSPHDLGLLRERAHPARVSPDGADVNPCHCNHPTSRPECTEHALLVLACEI